MTQATQKFTFEQPSQRGKMAAYFPVRDPLVPIERLKAFEAAKVDVIELGIKTADPFADGEIVASSMQRSLGAGTVRDAREAIEAVKAFSYSALGMIFAYAENKLAVDPLDWRSIDGLLGLGKPGPEVEAINDAASGQGTRITRFVPYHLPTEAVTAARKATGFVFLQYTQGKTGIRTDLDKSLKLRVQKLKVEGITSPIFAGIGISATDQVEHAMDAGVDGIVVGSQTILKAIAGQSALEDYVCQIGDALYG